VVKLDLGSGKKPMEGFQGVDKVPGISDHTVNLTTGEPWNFSDSSVDELWSNHFIEHVEAVDVPVWEKVRLATDCEPIDVLLAVGRHSQAYCLAGGWVWQRTDRKRDALLHFFSEAWRIAKPGASFTVLWPCIMHRSAYRDPTHRRFIDIEFLHYLSRAGRAILDVEQYDVECNWVGTATDLISKELLDVDTEEKITWLRQRAKTEWNIADQSMMQLVAEKP
jgi:hypothetical protein